MKFTRKFFGTYITIEGKEIDEIAPNSFKELMGLISFSFFIGAIIVLLLWGLSELIIFMLT